MTYKWKEQEYKTIKFHIDKHIVNNKIEMQLWKQEYLKDHPFHNESDFYSMMNRIPEINSLYKFYREKPFQIINLGKDDSIKYIYKSKSHYSCNYKRKQDGLTTCIKLEFGKYGRNDASILTCFFKKNIVNDALIIYISKYLLQNIPKDKIYTIKGALGLHNGNFNKAIEYCNYNSTNYSKRIDVVKNFIYKYLSLQFDFMRNSKEFFLEDYVFYYPLLRKLTPSRELKNIVDINIEKDKLISILNDKIKELCKYMDVDTEIEGVEEELALVELNAKSLDNSFVVTSKLAIEMIQSGLLD